MRFTPAFIFFLFHTSSSFIILFIWWVRWIWRRIIWRTWVWIRVSWYVRYQIGWIFAWFRISFRCHYFWQWVLRWWQRVSCTPISKYWWSVYLRMYLWCQYLLYWTNIVWIIYWSGVCWIIWIEMIRVSVILIHLNWFGIFVIQI